MDGGHPADAVEGVVDKVRVHLVLQHPVFQLLLATFVLHLAGHQAVHVFSQLDIPLVKSAKPQSVAFEPKRVRSLVLKLSLIHI